MFRMTFATIAVAALVSSSNAAPAGDAFTVDAADGKIHSVDRKIEPGIGRKIQCGADRKISDKISCPDRKIESPEKIRITEEKIDIGGKIKIASDGKI